MLTRSHTLGQFQALKLKCWLQVYADLGESHMVNTAWATLALMAAGYQQHDSTQVRHLHGHRSCFASEDASQLPLLSAWGHGMKMTERASLACSG